MSLTEEEMLILKMFAMPRMIGSVQSLETTEVKIGNSGHDASKVPTAWRSLVARGYLMPLDNDSALLTESGRSQAARMEI